MSPSENCYDFIKQWEGLFLHAYLDSGGVPTIGYGTIMYPNGSDVKMGDTCTIDQALEWLHFEVDYKTKFLNTLLFPHPLTQNQFDSIVSFCYNEGQSAFKNSRMYRKIKVNPNDETIFRYKMEENHPVVGSCEFLRWVYDNGNVVKGLINRRKGEADFYSTP